jgi:hypothetical protein
MPVLRTNYRRSYTANRHIRLDRVYMGPVNFSVNAYTDASGVAIVSAMTVLSIYGALVTSNRQLKPLAIRPISISAYSYSGFLNPSLMLTVPSMWASDSLAVFTPEFQSAAGSTVTVAGSAPAVVRMTAVVCSGP